MRSQVRLLDPRELMDVKRMVQNGEALHGGAKTVGTGKTHQTGVDRWGQCRELNSYVKTLSEWGDVKQH